MGRDPARVERKLKVIEQEITNMLSIRRGETPADAEGRILGTIAGSLRSLVPIVRELNEAAVNAAGSSRKDDPTHALDEWLAAAPDEVVGVQVYIKGERAHSPRYYNLEDR